MNSKVKTLFSVAFMDYLKLKIKHTIRGYQGWFNRKKRGKQIPEEATGGVL